MIKKTILFLIFGLLLSCDSPNAPDCLKKEGKLVQEGFVVNTFSKIIIEDDVALRITQGNTQKVIIETGENLLGDISVSVEGETLRIKNNASCELVRAYGVTTAIITTPNITDIRNSSAFDVVGEGILNFPRLVLTSNTTAGVLDPRKSGDFTMTIQTENFFINANGQSGFYIDGFAQNATIAFEDEAPRLEGKNLVVNKLVVFQRSANKMIVNPQESITGKIFGTGDVISINRPPIIDVEEFFTGRLIFQD
jgi:hypothetical protein